MTLFVNLFAGPGAGKSTTAAGVFYELKRLGYNCELVPEFAKSLVWEDRTETLKNQYYVTAKQYYMIDRLSNKADIVITDSPVLLGAIYGSAYPRSYTETLVGLHKETSTDGLNYIIRRQKPFEQCGRVHSYEESKAIDEEIRLLMTYYGLQWQHIDIQSAVDEIVIDVENQFNARTS